MLTLVLASTWHITVCANTIRSALHRVRLRWRRPQLAMPEKTDQEKALKQWKLVNVVIGAGEDAVIL